ncbi:hypothetical protein [Pseudomonas sp. NPDC089569]|uniref:hypothetical protein n=1 Tax=Pseudomonas sp. NPDC089569 TaxID=3390722 RepID=UPI003D07099E
MNAAQVQQQISTQRAENLTLKPVLQLGKVVWTRNFVALFPNETQLNTAVHTVLQKYQFGDWGLVSIRSKALNDEALDATSPGRVVAKYNIKAPNGRYVDIFVITEWDRSATTLMLPEDY